MLDEKIHFKDCSPLKTVNCIKKIFKGNSLKLDEIMSTRSEIDTYSCRINIKNTYTGSNGKGVNKEYALASGYAEFMERYQNGMFGIYNSRVSKNFYIAPDEKNIKITDLIKDNNPCINKLLLDGKKDKETFNNKVKYIKSLNYFDNLYFKKDDRLVCIPFYGISEKKLVYMPYNLYRYSIGSNGMCAGNSLEEALVQGFSEIFERIVQTRIFLEKPTLPEIPISLINKYPLIKEKIKLLKNNKEGFKYKFLDCSFNGVYPVVALLIYKENSAKYGIKLGAHPDLGVALERTLTEATQGQKLLSYSKQNDFSFNYKIDNINEIINSYKIGIGNYPYSLFGKKYTYKFKNFQNFKGKDNKKLLKNCINIFNKLGKKVYIRDCSIFKFPTYQIYIPNCSEIHYCHSKTIRLFNSRAEVSNIICNRLNNFNKEDIELSLAVMNYYSNDVDLSSISSYYQYVDVNDIPYEKYRLGIYYFVAMSELYLDNYNNCLNNLNKIYINLVKKVDFYNKDLVHIRCLMLVVEGLINKLSLSDIETHLKGLFDAKTLSSVLDMIRNKYIIFKNYPNMSNHDLLEKKYYKKIDKSYYQFYKAYINALVKSKIDQFALKRYF